MGEPVRGVPGMGRAAGPVFGGLAARGSIRAETCPDKRKSRGPGGPRLGGRSWGSRPASYLVVGTPLPLTALVSAALRG